MTFSNECDACSTKYIDYVTPGPCEDADLYAVSDAWLGEGESVWDYCDGELSIDNFCNFDFWRESDDDTIWLGESAIGEGEAAWIANM